MSQIKPYKHCKKCGALIVSGDLCEDCKPMTNADRIRQMTDDELAEFLTFENFCAHETCGFYSCEKCALKWLQKEADEDG